MRRTLLDTGWEVRPKVSRFAELSGAQGEPWQPVTLPHDAMIGTARDASAGPANAYYPGGTWEYRRTIEGPEEPRSVVLDLEGVYRDAAVIVNGEVVARRPSGYARFQVAIDHLLRPGSNELRVEATAGNDSRWYSGAGIHRDVWVLDAGPVHLDPGGLRVRVAEVDDAVAVVAVTAVLQNRTTTVEAPALRIEIIDEEGRCVAASVAPVTLPPAQEIDVRRRIHVHDPRRWGPDRPYLYTCRATLTDADVELDDDSTAFGIRTLELDPRSGLRINGAPTLLRGACIHHDNGVLGSAAFERAEERRVELLKGAGFNAIRSAHNPPSRALLEACDRLGVLVMDEAFDMWHEAKTEDDYARRFDNWWEADVEAMVRSAENHPSVILYSIGNEIPDGSTPSGLAVARRLAAKVRSLDDSRYVTQGVTGILIAGAEAFAGIGVNTVALSMAELMDEAVTSPAVDERSAEAFSILDVAGYNYMATRYEQDVAGHPDRVIVGSETHASAIGRDWPKVVALPNVIGDFTWTGWDYLGEVGIGRAHHGEPGTGTPGFHGPFPWRTAWCGDLDITGHRRPQSYYREIVYGLRTDPYVAVLRPLHERRPDAHGSPWGWPDVVPSWTWPGDEGQLVAVEVYAAADEVELVLDGRRLARQPVERFRATFEVPYAPGTLVAVATTVGAEVGRTMLRTASDEVRLQVVADRAAIRAGSRDLAFVELLLVDGDGTPHVGRDRLVSIAVEGPGVLQGIGSADPVSDEPFRGSSCTTFDGRAIAVVRPTGVGTITLVASAEACEPQRVEVRSIGE